MITQPSHLGVSIPTRVRLVAVGIVAGLVLIVHDLFYVLSAPLWLDEAWVAVAAHGALSDLPRITATSPVGFTFLVWLWPGASQTPRLIPIAFSIGSVVMAYLLVAGLKWRTATRSFLAGMIAAISVLLIPTSLVRNDLKQYSADACLSLLVLLLASRLEDVWGSGRLRVLAFASIAASSFSSASAFVSVSVFLALAGVATGERDWRRLRQILVAGSVAALGIITVFSVFVFPGVGGIEGYFAEHFLTLDGLARQMWDRISKASPLIGWPSPLITIALSVIAVAWLWRNGRRGVSLAGVILGLLMIGLGLAQRYPFLESRTSHFLLVVTATFCSIGLVTFLFTLWERSRPLALVMGVLFSVVFMIHVVPSLRTHSIPNEDVRSQVLFVQANRLPGDAVLVNLHGSYGFAHYWDGGGAVRFERRTLGIHFAPVIEADLPMVFAEDRTPNAVAASLQEALAKAGRPGASGRVWVVRSHVIPDEARAWEAAFRNAGTVPVSIKVGPEPLQLIELTDD